VKRAIIFGALAAATAAPAAAQQCTLEYQRADNMWAAVGRPDGALGKESITLQAGQSKAFVTDWKYEKQRNDGNNYYGSHARVVTNTGKRPLRLDLKGDIAGFIGGLKGALRQTASDRGEGELHPGTSWKIRADIQEVTCPTAAKEAKSETAPPGGVANPATIEPPTGLVARQAGPNEIVLTWEKVPGAREFRVYVQPPPQPHLAGRPGIVGASGTRFVIVVPPNVPASTVYQAWIEAVGTNGAVSRRAGFSPVSIQRPQGSGGGGPSSPAGGSFAGQSCPPGQFVTGFDGAGRILCARP
jgi:hypothetical protein